MSETNQLIELTVYIFIIILPHAFNMKKIVLLHKIMLLHKIFTFICNSLIHNYLYTYDVWIDTLYIILDNITMNDIRFAWKNIF